MESRDAAARQAPASCRSGNATRLVIDSRFLPGGAVPPTVLPLLQSAAGQGKLRRPVLSSFIYDA